MTTYNTDSTDSWHNIFIAFGFIVLLVTTTRLNHLVFQVPKALPIAWRDCFC